MHVAHPPPIIALPLADPLPKPWESCASNETSFLAHFEALSLHILSLAHPPSSCTSVMGIHPAIIDLRLHYK
jgi:hypothetical protein